MDLRFLIYEGFDNDAEIIFKSLIDKFNFKVIHKSDSGIKLENSRIILDIYYETSLQVWIINKSSQTSQMLIEISKDKGEEIYQENLSIMQCMHEPNQISNFVSRKSCLIKLSEFLSYNFYEDLRI